MRIFATDKKVLALSPNAGKLLQGLSSNTPQAVKNAFVTFHGKIIATFDQLRISDDEFLIVLEAFALPPVLEHLDRYLKLNKTAAEVRSLNVYFDLDGDLPVQPGDLVLPQKAGRLILTARQIAHDVGPEEFTRFRVAHNLPQHGVDYTDDFLLNVDEFEFVSYTKGCFLGQEPIAKVHNRSKPSWKLLVRFEEDCSPDEQAKMTSKVVDPVTGRTQGFVFTSNKTQ